MNRAGEGEEWIKSPRFYANRNSCTQSPLAIQGRKLGGWAPCIHSKSLIGLKCSECKYEYIAHFIFLKISGAVWKRRNIWCEWILSRFMMVYRNVDFRDALKMSVTEWLLWISEGVKCDSSLENSNPEIPQGASPWRFLCNAFLFQPQHGCKPQRVHFRSRSFGLPGFLFSLIWLFLLDICASTRGK